MTGLPGVQLGIYSNASQAQVVNTTGKTIFGLTLRSDTSPTEYEFNMFWLGWNPIPSDGVPHMVGQYLNRVNHHPVQVSIDSIIFTDGSFTGPDTDKNFNGLSQAVDAFVAAGTLGMNKAWSQLQTQISTTQGPPSSPGHAAAAIAAAQKMSAESLMVAYNYRGGEPAALGLAARYVALGKLHR